MFGHRISKVVDGDATYFVYDREDVILDINNDGNIEQRYLHGMGADMILAQESGIGEVQWNLTDHLGSIRNIVNSNGELLNHITYDSFGNIIAETDETIDSRYLYHRKGI